MASSNLYKHPVNMITNFLIFKFVLIGLFGCKEASNNTLNSQTTENAVFDSSDNVLRQKIFQAAVDAKGIFSAEDYSMFFNESQIDAIQSEEIQNFDLTFVGTEKISTQAIVWVYRHGANFINLPKGGMTFVGYDVFPEGYYRNNNITNSSMMLEKFLFNAPWFHWDQTNQRFIPKKDSSQERLLEYLWQSKSENSKIKLYRGSSGLPSVRSLMSDTNPTETNYSFQLFMTPSLEAATGWASPLVSLSELTKAELKQLMQKSAPLVYMGIEFDYVEIAFLKNKKGDQVFSQLDPKSYCLDRTSFESRRKGWEGPAEKFPHHVNAIKKIRKSGIPWCKEYSAQKKLVKTKVKTQLKTKAISSDKLSKFEKCTLPENTKIFYGRSGKKVNKHDTLLGVDYRAIDWDCWFEKLDGPVFFEEGVLDFDVEYTPKDAYCISELTTDKKKYIWLPGHKIKVYKESKFLYEVNLEFPTNSSKKVYMRGALPKGDYLEIHFLPNEMSPTLKVGTSEVPLLCRTEEIFW